MTTGQLARHLNVTRDAIHKAIRRGRLTAEQRTDPHGEPYYWVTEADADAYAAYLKSKAAQGGRPRKENR